MGCSGQVDVEEAMVALSTKPARAGTTTSHILIFSIRTSMSFTICERISPLAVTGDEAYFEPNQADAMAFAVFGGSDSAGGYQGVKSGIVENSEFVPSLAYLADIECKIEGFVAGGKIGQAASWMDEAVGFDAIIFWPGAVYTDADVGIFRAAIFQNHLDDRRQLAACGF